MIKFLRNLSHPGRVQKQYDKIIKATKNYARALSDAEYERHMAHFYTERVMSIDPFKDHMGFAEARQKQLDYQEDCVRCEKKAEVALACMRAEEERYKTLREVS